MTEGRIGARTEQGQKDGGMGRIERRMWIGARTDRSKDRKTGDG